MSQCSSIVSFSRSGIHSRLSVGKSLRVMHISELPTELHEHIVALASSGIPTDGEITTAHTLSLVSSYWYSVACPFRYYSLRVAGTHYAGYLLSQLEGLPEHERHVRYLLLSDAPLDGVIDDETTNLQQSIIAQLLALLTRSLYELELHLANSAYATSLFALLWALPSPCLVSLSVKGYYPFPTIPLNPSRQASKSNFPRLERLSVDGVSNPAGLLSFIPLEEVFPRLAALEVRGLRSALSFARELAKAVEEHKDRPRVASPTASRRNARASYLPRGLRSISLFLSPEPYSKRGHAMHSEMSRVLMPLTAKSTLKVIVVEPDAESAKCTRETARFIPISYSIRDFTSKTTVAA